MPANAQESLTAGSTTHIHEIYIKADASTIWEALTKPEWTARYGYRGMSHYELKPGGRFRCMASDAMKQMGLPELMIDGEVIEVQPPHKLVQTYRFLFNDAHRAEGFTRISWEVVPTEKGFCRVTVTHDTTGAPMMTGATRSKFDLRGSGGWNWILSDLKSLLETGKTMDA
jgi:uncharacterized protein YndB with AHSA1/START domain